MLSKYDYGRIKTLTVPEVATFIANSGGFIDMSNWSKEKIIDFQTNLLITQIRF